MPLGDLLWYSRPLRRAPSPFPQVTVTKFFLQLPLTPPFLLCMDDPTEHPPQTAMHSPSSFLEV